MENNAKQVQANARQVPTSISEKGANSEDLLTSTVTLRTNEVLEHLGVHYAHENPLTLQLMQEEEEKKQAQKAKKELLYQSLSTEETPNGENANAGNAKGENAVFEAAGLLSKLGEEVQKNAQLDETVNLKVDDLNTKNLLTQEKLIDDFMKYMKSVQGDWWEGNYAPEGNKKDFEQLIEDLKAYFKGDPKIETMLNNMLSGFKDGFGEGFNWNWMGQWYGGFFYQTFKNQVMPQLESILEKALQMPSPFQRVLNEEMAKVEKENNQASQFLLALQIKAAEGKEATGQNAVFESAALVSDVADDAQKNEINNLQKRVQELRLQLQNLVKMEQLLVKYSAAVKQFEKTKDFGDFFKVILLLFGEFGKNPGIRKELNQILNQGIGAYMDANVMDWWFGDNNFIWTCFADSIVSTLDNIVKSNSEDPALAELFLSQGKKDFDKVIKDALKAITEIEQIVRFIEEDKGEQAIFMMEAVMMQLEAVALKKNADQNKIQEKESQQNIIGLKQTLTKIDAALKKLEKAQHHHHHGIFGWLEDAFDEIKSVLSRIAHIFADVVTCHFSNLGSDFKEFAKGFKMYAKMFSALIHGKIAKAFEDFEGIMVSGILTGGIGFMGTDGAFTKDIQQTYTLMVDAVRAFGQLVVAGLADAYGGKAGAKFAAKMMASDKKLGVKMLENPQLKPLMDVAMVVVIIAAAAAQQYWLAGIMTVMLVASDFGGMQFATKELTNLFELMHIPPKIAKVMADITIVIIVTALTMGTGTAESAGEVAGDEAANAAADAASAAADGAEDGAEEAEEVVEQEVTVVNAGQQVVTQAIDSASQNAENAANAAKDEDGLLTKAAKGIGKRMTQRTGAGLVGFSMGLSSTNLGLDLAKLIDAKNKDLEKTLEWIQRIMAVIAGIVGGCGMAYGTAATSAAEEADSAITNGIRKIMPKLARYMEENAAALTQTASQAQRAQMVVQGVGQSMEGGLDILRGDYQAELSKQRGLFQAFQAYQQITNAAIQQTTTHRGTLIKEFDKWNDEIIEAPAKIADAQYQAMSQSIV